MICVDTMVLVWGVRGEPINPQDAERGMVARAKAYLAGLDPAIDRILVPSPVIAELLVPIADQEQRSALVLREIGSTMVVGQLNLPAAVLAARITRRNRNAARASGSPATRQELRVDALVLGVALANGCRAIVTDDVKGMAALADGFPIKVLELPEPPAHQRPLFPATPSPPAGLVEEEL